MTSEERAIVLCWWTSLCAFAASWYLAGSLWKAIAVAVFVFGSMFLSFGARWLARLTFAASRDRRGSAKCLEQLRERHVPEAINFRRHRKKSVPRQKVKSFAVREDRV